MRTIEHPHGVTEVILSDEYPHIGAMIGPSRYPYTYGNIPYRRFALLQAASGLQYRPKIKPHASGDKANYLALESLATGARVTIRTESVDEYVSALHELGERT